jgi:hypothetical protein
MVRHSVGTSRQNAMRPMKRMDQQDSLGLVLAIDIIISNDIINNSHSIFGFGDIFVVSWDQNNGIDPRCCT